MEINLTVGQSIYGKPGYNNRRVSGLVEKDGLLKGEVQKVGRKYIEVLFNGRTYKFEKETLKEVTKYMPNYHIILDREKYSERQKLLSNVDKIKRIIEANSSKLTLEDTRKILDILPSEE